MERTLYASKNQMFKAFGVPTDDGLTVPCPVWVTAEAGMHFVYFKRRYEPNPIDVQHQIVIYPTATSKQGKDDELQPWRCEYKAACAANWAEQRLELFANTNRSRERKVKGRPTHGPRVYTKDGVKTKPAKTVSALERWNKRAKRNAKIVAKRGQPNYGLVRTD
jgi:hypothetical protein